MAPARLASLLVLLAVLAPAALRSLRRPEPPAPPCAAEGRGQPPRHWIGCAADPGPRRELTGGERFLLGLPLDPNRATAAELALLPGLSPRLARELVADRRLRGPFGRVDEVERVRGIGPVRLERLRPHLAVGPRGPAPGEPAGPAGPAGGGTGEAR